MARISSRRKIRGTARTTALKLFGVPGKMERPSDRENIVLILRHSPNPRVQALCRMAQDSIYKTTSFAQLAENLALNYHDLAKEYKEIQRSMGYVRAAAHLPDLMEQTMLDAQGKVRTCKRCAGEGKITVGKDDAAHEADCPLCEGKGKRYEMGDTDRLRMALEMFSLTGKTGGGVAVNLDLRQTEKPESLESLSESLGPILEGKTNEPV